MTEQELIAEAKRRGYVIFKKKEWVSLLKCPICGKPMEIIREVLGQERHLPIMCDCQREQERQIREQRHLQELADLGAERSSEYMQELVFSVIDSRYESGKPVVITTNLTLQDLKDPQTAQQSRIYDRILQMCHPLKVDGESIRRKDTKKRYYEMKKELEG